MKYEIGTLLPVMLLQLAVKCKILERVFAAVIEVDVYETAAALLQQGGIFIVGSQYEHLIALVDQVSDHIQPEIVDRPGTVRDKCDQFIRFRNRHQQILISKISK